MRQTLIMLVFAMALSACGSGLYSFAREYDPLGDEADYFDRQSHLGYVDIARDPLQHSGQTVGWFGVVTAVEMQDGRALTTLAFRAHRQHHLCSDERASSCRVTVSARTTGRFTSTLVLPTNDGAQLAVGSLVKIYGSPNGEFDEEGGPVITPAYYRHWPPGTWVTTNASSRMRRN